MFFLDITEPTFSYFAPIIAALVTLMVAIVTAATPVLVHAVVKYLKNKSGIEISEKEERDFGRIVKETVHAEEQKARTRLKLGEEAPEAAKRLQNAVFLIEKKLKTQGIYDKFVEDVADKIEATLGESKGHLSLEERDEIKRGLSPLKGGEKPAMKPLPERSRKRKRVGG